jgi:dihydroorotase
MINRNHMLVGGIRPHYYCLPVAKRSTHQIALRAAATSGNPRFFLGTDSAPHTDDAAKETACGCAGVFSATNTMSCLAHVFEEEARSTSWRASPRCMGPRATGLRRTRRR